MIIYKQPQREGEREKEKKRVCDKEREWWQTTPIEKIGEKIVNAVWKMNENNK